MHTTIIRPCAILGAAASLVAALQAAAQQPAGHASFTNAALSAPPVLYQGASSAGDGAAAGASSGAAPGAGASRAPAGGAAGTDGANGTAGTQPAATASAAPRRFGQAGMVTFNVFGDFMSDFDGANAAGAQIGVSWFVVDNFSLDLQLEQYGVWQPGTDAYAVGPALLFRWHFLPRETWSLYVDGGCGFTYATNPVPADGTRFDFTPRLGMGWSVAIAGESRLLTGVRWFHDSNGNTLTPNPGRDSLEVYAGLSIPF